MKQSPAQTRCASALAAALLAALCAGCGHDASSGRAEARAPSAPYPLEVAWEPPALDTSSWTLDPVSAPSERALIEAVFRALERGSEQDLAALCFSRRSYTAHLYPYLPVSMPVRNTPASFVWKQHWLRVSAGLRDVLRQWKGRKLSYVSHAFEEPDQTYGPFTLRRDVVVEARDPEGRTVTLRPFRSLILLRGRCKVFSFPR